jgi:hypothetical protein
LKILVACEESQAVTKEFRLLGHEAYSCDIEPCSGGHPEWHAIPRDKNGKILRYNSLETKRIRSKTFPGIAKAMATQWAGEAEQMQLKEAI